MQRSTRSISSHADRTERPLGARQRSSFPLAHHVGAEPGAERLGHLLADLVAAGPDRRADGCGEPASPQAPRRPQRQCPRAARASPCAASASAGGPPFSARVRAGRGRRSSPPSAGPARPSRGRRRACPSARPRLRLTLAEWRCRLSASCPNLGVESRAEPAPVLLHVLWRNRPVNRPRLSDANAPSLTPPRRVENATACEARRIPGEEWPGRSRLRDQVPRGGEARRRGRPAHRSACAAAARRGSPPPAATRRSELCQVAAGHLQANGTESPQK